ncbi:RNase J family beta-CASP ribonuclease [Rhodohalobacter sp. SW132]|uniref:RNase J family beta-CASP ribonuclease n=1 Tax=Rhodohalobacter sp. SW132 TaxID=2293433 RepID=UPI000E2825F5|nr:RNase J family beta-CASP ribonuclease [Rhodohalobacter sp. SW132]REL39024.1 RNase J family beta-CASP ribonuclease [Rhodohalobacter sp. SW132]
MKIYTIGGYNEVGKNMTAIEVRDEIVILDMGYDMEELIDMESEAESSATKNLIHSGVIPNDKEIYQQREKVKGIIIGHGHLDHVGAVAKMAGSYNCPIFASPYTMKIVEEQIRQDDKGVKNERVVLMPGNIHNLTSNFAIEFVKVTHSIPDTMLTILHTPEGRVAYGLDFRIDRKPVLGETVDFDRLNELGSEGVKVLIGDSTRAGDQGTSSTESAVKEQLSYTLDQIYGEQSAVVVTTFSSHIERLKSILEANAGRRKVAFIGRSLKDYTLPARDLGYIDLKNVKMASYRDEVNDLFEKITENRENWLIVCTGNQGESRSVLEKLSNDRYEFRLQAGDHVVFSTSTIPTLINMADRYRLERNLKNKKVTLHMDIHASGHGHREDLRLLIQTLKPEIMIPAHGDIQKLAEHATIAQEEGYILNQNLFICENGNVLEF